MAELYKFTPKDAEDQPWPFTQLEGKVALIVNVASKCGFTPQYTELESLYKKYSDQGLIVIGFPCNNFGRQEPGTDEEIQSFCKQNYGVTFPILKKIDVNGSNSDPVYQYIKEKKPGLLGFRAIKWNFEKFLVDREGNVVERFSSLTKPSSIEAKIEELLLKE